MARGGLETSVWLRGLLLCGIACSASCREDDSPYWEGCELHCLDLIECRDGVVTEWPDSIIACEDYTGECPHHSWPCEEGCRYEPSYASYYWPNEYDSSAFALLCSETPAAQPGDECWDDNNCLPTEAVIEPDGTVANAHLVCGRDLHECVPGEPPPPPEDWLQPCGFTPGWAPPFVDERYYAGTCTNRYTDGVCLFARAGLDDCIHQGCSRACLGDWECPADSICDGSLTKLGGSMQKEGGVCRPNPAGSLTDVLPCSPAE